MLLLTGGGPKIVVKLEGGGNDLKKKRPSHVQGGGIQPSDAKSREVSDRFVQRKNKGKIGDFIFPGFNNIFFCPSSHIQWVGATAK